MKRLCEESSSDTESDGTIDVGKEEEYSHANTPGLQEGSGERNSGQNPPERHKTLNHKITDCAFLLLNTQGSSKLEKAEILQMTVDHLKMLHATGGTGFLDARALAVDYRSIGFRECLTEVVRYLGILEGQNTADPIRLRLLSHLNNYVAEMEPSPVATSLLPIQTWPWSFLHSAASPVQIPRREAAPAPVVLTASSLAYPSPAVRPAPLRRVPGDMLPSRRSFLATRMASSSRRARATGSSAAVAAMPRMPSPTGMLREGSSKSSQIATFLFSPASAGIPVPPGYTAPPALGTAVQGPGIRVGTSRICRSWATEIGAF
ncbi:Hairy/enhancer-of-split related with YRPW motif-like [Struthio camelus australis]|uniref:Hairy/enhancer-of-split related with YRPW motif-like n=1 Tax=Struthio camelus australis TaxID=441894 RepID=A0A093H493_STRCA|nr:Hairy/enhancer-of-split related with YRPW motif-like [Struthio camelus australis]